MDIKSLALLKKGEICDEADFMSSVNDCTSQSTIGHCFHVLSHFGWVFFPNGKRRAKEEIGLYDQIKEILRGAYES